MDRHVALLVVAAGTNACVDSAWAQGRNADGGPDARYAVDSGPSGARDVTDPASAARRARRAAAAQVDRLLLGAFALRSELSAEPSERSFGYGGLGVAAGGGGMARTPRPGGGGGAIGGLSASAGGLGTMRSTPVALGSARTGALQVSGALQAAVVRRVSRAGERAVTDCYARARIATDALSSRVVVRYVIDERGAVRESTVVEATPQNAASATCISTVVRRWGFPAAGPSVVTQAFTYERLATH